MIFRKLLREFRLAKAVNYPIRNIIKSMGNFSSLFRARWPVSGIINFKYEGVKFKLYNRCDDHQASYYYYNLPFHETKIIKLMCAFAKKTKVIMDIGANTGMHSVIVSKINPGTKIYAIEPYPPNYTRVEKNLFINECNNVEVKKIALGDKEAMITFYVPEDNIITDVTSAVENHGTRIYEDQIKWKKSEVKQSTINKLSAEIGQIDFFKCDVESYEINVFKGGEDFFAANRPPFIVEICLDDNKVSFFNDFASRFNYNIYFVSEEGFIRLDKLYVFDRWPNFLFTQYKSEHNFIPYKDIDEFVDNALSANSFVNK